MISNRDYLGKWSGSLDLTPVRYANMLRLLHKVNTLIQKAAADGVVFKVNPATKTQVAGKTYGGFRPQDCPQGSPQSAHKEALAVDIYDPEGSIDDWLRTSPVAQRAFVELGLYFEHHSATVGWSHWTIRRPNSGKRFFYP